VEKNIAFLELKYGNIYGGPPNFFAISEVALLVFEPSTNRIFMESLLNTADIDIVSVYSRVNELGNTTGKVREVVNLRTRRRKRYIEDFTLDKVALKRSFDKLHPSKRVIKGFFLKNFKKYNFNTIITFDGRRDIFLCERTGVDFRYQQIVDLQKEINRETNYLFSLNKLAKVINFSQDVSYLRSNNLEFWLHPIASRQIRPKLASYDAARMLMIHEEFFRHKDDFLIKAALLLNKIEQQSKEMESGK
jgi:hypothetical protein